MLDVSYRIIDANFNRTIEGIRVVEDICRFVFNDYSLATRLRKLRHNITSTRINLSKSGINLILHRDTKADVGAKTPLLTKRKDVLDILDANTQRVKESLRVLEEVSRIVNERLVDEFQRARFEFYDIEKAIMEKIKPIIDFALYAIIDIGTINKLGKGENFPVRLAEEAIKGGVTIIQLRDKVSLTSDFLKIAFKLRKLTSSKKIPFIINDRVDIAGIVNADGVHLGDDDVSIHEARKILGSKIIGISTHSLKEAITAEKKGPDYISAGPVFETHTKLNARAPIGLKELKKICMKVKIPVVAIGGINEGNAASVIKNGANGAAIISGIFCKADVKNTTRRILKKIKGR